MHTSHELIELAKKRLALRHNVPLPMTDYRLSKLLGVSTQVMSGWRTGARGIGTDFAALFADACGLPGPYVLACIEHERAKNADVRSILETIAKAFKGKAAAWITGAILAAGMNFAPSGNQAVAASFERPAVCIIYV